MATSAEQIAQLEAAIAGLEAQRAALGEAVAAAALAPLALAAGALSRACAYVEIILDHLTDHPLGGTMEQPLRVHLTCYRVLRAGEDPRAAAVLQRAGEQLRAWAATLAEPARRLFLELPAQRALLAEHDAAQLPGA